MSLADFQNIKVSSEQKYHELPLLSYSILARYEREGGFKSLPENKSDLWAPTEKTDALIFGAALDTLVTKEWTENDNGFIDFANQFVVCDCKEVPDKSKRIMNRMIQEGIGWYDTDMILKIMDEQFYYPNWKNATRISKFCEDDAHKYFDVCRDAESTGKTVIPIEMKNRVFDCYNQLKGTELTKALLFAELPEYRERHFQLKFEAELWTIKYKIMCDMILVDNEKRTITIYDIKTSGKESYCFKQSYLEWGYHIQSHLYRMVLQEALKNTPYSDYVVKDFYFIVASKVNDTPLVFKDESERVVKKPWLRDPREIGMEIENSFSSITGERNEIPTDFSYTVPNIISFNND